MASPKLSWDSKKASNDLTATATMHDTTYGDQKAEEIRGMFAETRVHPLGLALLVLFGICMLLMPRKYSLWPLVFVSCFIPPSQQLIILSLNFQFQRIMILFAYSRILLRSEYKGIQLHFIDYVVVAHAITKAMVYTLQYGTAQAFISQTGVGFDTLGMYLTFRCLIKSLDDLRSFTLGLIVASVPCAAAFTLEHFTGRNIFSVFGYVSEITQLREGKLRCQGAFVHPIIAGVFWASILPLVVTRLFASNMNRFVTILGIICPLICVIFCASSHPIMTVAMSIAVGSLYPWRRYTKVMRWGLLIVLVTLHMSMKSPVWSLIARIDLAGGSTGHHRYRLINGAVDNFSSWWMLGTRTTEAWGFGLWDVTNQYIAEGVTGGLATMLLFILLMTLTFKQLGQRIALADIYGTTEERVIFWALGVTLFVHAVGFNAVSYFGQAMLLVWLSFATSSISYPSDEERDRFLTHFAPDTDQDEYAYETELLVGADLSHLQEDY